MITSLKEYYNIDYTLAFGKSKQPGKYYVYMYYDIDRDVPIYVGKGAGRRAFHHINQAINGKIRTSRFINRLKTLLSINCPPIIEIVEDSMSEECAIDLEEYLIKKFGRRIVDEGSLYNVSKRGFGNGGVPLTDAQKKAVSDFWKGRPKSEEHKRKISESNKGRNNFGKLTEAGRERIKIAVRRKKSAETRKRMSEAQRSQNNPLRGKKLSEAHCLALREAAKTKKPRTPFSYLLTHPEMEDVIIHNLAQYCKENSLDPAYLRTTLRKKQALKGGRHKGYRLYYFGERAHKN